MLICAHNICHLKWMHFRLSAIRRTMASCLIKPTRLGPIEGIPGKKNEVIYHPHSCTDTRGYLIFFGGDIQDYEENMLKHRDNKYHVQWNLENTCCLLHRHFPDHEIIVIKPFKMTLMTFSCYSNFTQVSDFGVPLYQKSCDSLGHLRALIGNVEASVHSVKLCNPEQAILRQELPIKLVGFSKGCVVLNQFLYSFLAVKEEENSELISFVDRISDMFWLDGGHSGESETWITNRQVLQNFASLRKRVHIFLTPFQVCEEKPRIKSDEKRFKETLMKLGCEVKRELHFADEPRSIENHFKVLEVFKS